MCGWVVVVVQKCVERRRKILVSICGPDCTSRLVSLVWHSLVAQELPEVER